MLREHDPFTEHARDALVAVLAGQGGAVADCLNRVYTADLQTLEAACRSLRHACRQERHARLHGPFGPPYRPTAPPLVAAEGQAQ